MKTPKSHAQGLLSDALGYLGRGIACVPTRGKRPLQKWSEWVGSPSEEQVREAFSQPGVDGVAVITGSLSGGLAVRDFDKPEGYEKFQKLHPDLARSLPTVRTGRGTHVWCRSDLLKILFLGDGEFRGGRGICVAPHSRHSSGRFYEWINPLPAKELPLVPHTIFTGQLPVTEVSGMPCSDGLCVSLPLSVTGDGSSLPISVTAEGSSLPISATADEANRLQVIEWVIQQTLPKHPGERNAKVFDLARGLKFNAGLSDPVGDAVARRHALRRWFEFALPNITSKNFDVTAMDFDHAFAEARHPLGANLLDSTAARVDAASLPAAAARYESDSTRQLVAWCAELAALNPLGHFFLSTHEAGARMGMAPMQAWRIFKLLEKDGILERLKTGNQRRATRYRFVGVGVPTSNRST